MRLKEFQIKGIVAGIEKFISSPAELRLYGSRADDNKKGGDIDLLLIVEEDFSKNKLKENDIKILIAVQENIGEQKIDLTIATRDELNSKPFLNAIYPQSVFLHRWK